MTPVVLHVKCVCALFAKPMPSQQAAELSRALVDEGKAVAKCPRCGTLYVLEIEPAAEVSTPPPRGPRS